VAGGLFLLAVVLLPGEASWIFERGGFVGWDFRPSWSDNVLPPVVAFVVLYGGFELARRGHTVSLLRIAGGVLGVWALALLAGIAAPSTLNRGFAAIGSATYCLVFVAGATYAALATGSRASVLVYGAWNFLFPVLSGLVFSVSEHSSEAGQLIVELWGMTLSRSETLAIFGVLSALSAGLLLGAGPRIHRRYFEAARDPLSGLEAQSLP
jgi:hypothetical protein